MHAKTGQLAAQNMVACLAPLAVPGMAGLKPLNMLIQRDRYPWNGVICTTWQEIVHPHWQIPLLLTYMERTKAINRGKGDPAAVPIASR